MQTLIRLRTCLKGLVHDSDRHRVLASSSHAKAASTAALLCMRNGSAHSSTLCGAGHAMQEDKLNKASGLPLGSRT